MKIINLTPHAIKDVESGITFFPASKSARVKVVRQCVAISGGVRFYATSYGQVENLPDHNKDTTLIVSAMVRLAHPERLDLVSPGELVRDDNGNVIGCKGFDSNVELI